MRGRFQSRYSRLGLLTSARAGQLSGLAPARPSLAARIITASKLVEPGEPSSPQVSWLTQHLGGKRDNAQDRTYLSASEKGGRSIDPARTFPGGIHARQK